MALPIKDIIHSLELHRAHDALTHARHHHARLATRWAEQHDCISSDDAKKAMNIHRRAGRHKHNISSQLSLARDVVFENDPWRNARWTDVDTVSVSSSSSLWADWRPSSSDDHAPPSSGAPQSCAAPADPCAAVVGADAPFLPQSLGCWRTIPTAGWHAIHARFAPPDLFRDGARARFQSFCSALGLSFLMNAFEHVSAEDRNIVEDALSDASSWRDKNPLASQKDFETALHDLECVVNAKFYPGCPVGAPGDFGRLLNSSMRRH